MAEWSAEPHTLAKIAILRKYLDAWFPIVGRTFTERTIFYVDGFAGPGRYKGGELGSPIVALESATQAIANGHATRQWKAAKIQCVFVESDSASLISLNSRLGDRKSHSWVNCKGYLGEFDSARKTIKSEFPASFQQSPLFVFLDPFGPKGLSFSTVTEILQSPSSEILLHFDADGATRMIQALAGGHNKSSELTLNAVFGSDVWRASSQQRPDGKIDFEKTTRELVRLYLQEIRSFSKFAYPFQMITPAGRARSEVGYYLIFASNHPRGLEEMKTVMKSVGQDGQFRFSNFRSQRPLLFAEKYKVDDDARLMHKHFFPSRSIRWDALVRFALNETVAINPKQMLKFLEQRKLLEVECSEARRANIYPDRLTHLMRFNFVGEAHHGEEISD